MPAELALVTTPQGVRVTRNPTSELTTLYDEQTHFPATTLAAGQNLLACVASKAFDFELTIDAAAGTASQITFRIADLTFVYDVAAQTLFGQPLPLRAGKVKIRMLADHGELEVFGNDGLFSYSTSQLFAPDDTSVSFTANGSVALSSVGFRTLKRVCPARRYL